MNRLTLRCAVCTAGLWVAAGGVSASTYNPDPNDAWDISRGALATTNSGAGWWGTDIRDMFGGEYSSGAAKGYVLFADGRGAGSVHWVEWETPAPVEIGGFHLVAMRDNNINNYRALSHFKLTYGTTATNRSTALYNQDVTYQGPQFLDLSFLFSSPVTARYFRAEFTQAASSGDYGPRIVELDAVVPEPAGLALVTVGALGLLRRRQS